LFENKDILVLSLKEKHMKQQNEIVKDIKIMSEESRKIINDISVIETDLEKYQVHVD
jgi:hypothetical protein